MNDKDIEYEIRKELRKRFPDIVFQVQYSSKQLEIGFLGGDLGNYYDMMTEDMKNEIMETIWSVNPDLELWFD